MFNHIAANWRLASVALLGVLGVVASGCSAGALPSATPFAAVSIASSASPISPPEVTAPAGTPKTTPPPTAGPSASSSQQAIRDGVYVTGNITQPLALAALKAAHVPLDAATKAVTDTFSYPGSWKMQLDHGHLTRWCSGGGGALAVCDKETYAFSDAHTMVVQDAGGPCVARLALRWQGPELHLTVLSAPCNREYLVVNAVSFGATPWTLAP